VAPAAHRRGPIKGSLERAPPPSRANASLERALPRLRANSSLERAPPRSRLPHERTCSHTRVRAFNALTQQSRAITRLGIAPRRCSANSLGETHPRHCGELCSMAEVSSVTLGRPLPYGKHAAPSKGPAAPSNPFLVTLQGQTVTSGRRERHPHHYRSCAAIPAPAAPRQALLQQLRRC
jgi:hypothetical protein